MQFRDIQTSKYLMVHFSGHGITVVGRQIKIIFDESPYIIWDGRSIRQYQPTNWHDCMVLHDMQLISLQRIRYHLIGNGVEPVIIFPCQIGESSIEITIPSTKGKNKFHGLASYCRMKVLTKYITLRDFIVQTNLLSAKMGFDQVGEVICRKELLDDKLVDPEYNLKPVCVYLIDMCRVYGNIEDYKIDDVILAP